MDQNLAWLTQKIEEPKSNKGNLTFPSHTVSMTGGQSNEKVATPRPFTGLSPKVTGIRYLFINIFFVFFLMVLLAWMNSINFSKQSIMHCFSNNIFLYNDAEFFKVTYNIFNLSTSNSWIASFKLAKSAFLAKSDVLDLLLFSLRILLHN